MGAATAQVEGPSSPVRTSVCTVSVIDHRKVDKGGGGAWDEGDFSLQYLRMYFRTSVPANM